MLQKIDFSQYNDKELKELFDDFLEFDKTGILKSCNLRTLIDSNSSTFNNWFCVADAICTQFLCEISKRYFEKNELFGLLPSLSDVNVTLELKHNIKKEVQNQNSKKTIKILDNLVEYEYLNDNLYLDGILISSKEVKHIQKMISEGKEEGEICNLECVVAEYGKWKTRK